VADEKKGLGGVEVASVVVVGVFAVVVLFWLFGFIAGAVWWAVKVAMLIAVLFLVVRWAIRRSVR
jgi:hypothetical protein